VGWPAVVLAPRMHVLPHVDDGRGALAQHGDIGDDDAPPAERRSGVRKVQRHPGIVGPLIAPPAEAKTRAVRNGKTRVIFLQPADREIRAAPPSGPDQYGAVVD